MTKREYLESIGYENPYIAYNSYYTKVYWKEIVSSYTGDKIRIEIDLHNVLYPNFGEKDFEIKVLGTIFSQEQIDELQEVYNSAKKDFEEMMKYED